MSTPPRDAEFRNPDELTLVVSTCQRGGTWGASGTGLAYFESAGGAGASVPIAPGGAGSRSYTTTNSRRITGWTTVRVTRGIERCPGDFEIEFTERYPGATDVQVQPGDECEVYLGTDLVLSGFIDRFMPGYTATQHTIRVSGRGRCQDLLDCSAKWQGGQFRDARSLLDIAQQLCAAYSIRVSLAEGSSPGVMIPFLNILVGESIYEVLERECRFEQLLLYEQADGSLLLSQVGTQQAACGFQEGVNVLSASAIYSMDQRFSDYDLVRMALDTCQDIGEGGNLIYRISDANVPRFRYHAVVAEQVVGATPPPAGDPNIPIRRLQWEMARRIGRSYQVRITTDSWRDSAQQLWTPNTLVPLDLPGLKMQPQTWLISEVSYRRDLHHGTTAELLIMPPQAFQPQPILLYPYAPDITPGTTPPPTP